MIYTSTKMVPIKNQNKIEQIVDSIKKMIIEGELEAGTFLPSERELSIQLGVNRFSLREALQVAKSHGLITVGRGKRPQVAGSSPNAAAEIISTTIERSKTSLFDLIEARQCLECQIVRLASERVTTSDIQMLEENVAQLEESVAQLEEHRGDVSDCIENDVQFHNILVKASRNIVFEIMLSPLAQALRESRKQTMMKADGRFGAINGHRLILNAIKAHDAEGAAMAMSEHLRMAKTNLKKTKRK